MGLLIDPGFVQTKRDTGRERERERETHTHTHTHTHKRVTLPGNHTNRCSIPISHTDWQALFISCHSMVGE